MHISLMAYSGLSQALYGLGLSYGLTSNITYSQFCSLHNTELYDKLFARALKLAPKDLGHNKFLEHIQTWWDIRLTRYMWSEFDTYRVGVSKQSESTMHTIKKRPLTPKDFSPHTLQSQIDEVNHLIETKASIEKIKANLPEGFYQAREVNISLKSLINIYRQRQNHHLQEWHTLIEDGFKQLPPDYQKLVQI